MVRPQLTGWEVQQTCSSHSLVLFGFYCTNDFTLKGQVNSSGSLFQITPAFGGSLLATPRLSL